MWREFAAEFSDVRLSEGVGGTGIRAIESGLGQSIPPALSSLLLETDGIEGEYGIEVVWTAEKILSQNAELRSDGHYRTLYMPFDSLLFFGDNGGGDQFAFVRTPERDDVFVWDHETDSRTWISPHLESYLRSALGSAGEDWYR
ncbi:SMI1/KNR4 family protein [Streptomyces sp. KL118A]|uniref:SMI1/KNR4 family protein n=1 Tax=Streptomyces sp. KL118A TaxID=3045153 RepID=UPI00278C67AD|nr:SMI1/KNR4 family protein [Streptomyces sp. KL118A]